MVLDHFLLLIDEKLYVRRNQPLLYVNMCGKDVYPICHVSLDRLWPVCVCVCVCVNFTILMGIPMYL